MEMFVAKSYENMDRIGEPFEKNGRKYTKVSCDCERCGGSGIYIWGAMINGNPSHAGTCFKCGGSGKLVKEVRLYTEKERAAADRAREQRREKAIVEREARAKARNAKAFDKWLNWNGFNEDGDTYLIFGNTYPIKDELKAAGCKFSKTLLWHGPAAVDVPEDCYVEKINWSDIYDWNEEARDMWLTEEGDNLLKEIFSKNSEGKYLGEVGERLRNIPVIFEGMVTFDGSYGLAHIYKFNADGAQLSWFTECIKDLEEGKAYQLSGTVKKQEVYRNVKTTYLSRCIIK